MHCCCLSFIMLKLYFASLLLISIDYNLKPQASPLLLVSPFWSSSPFPHHLRLHFAVSSSLKNPQTFSLPLSTIQLTQPVLSTAPPRSSARPHLLSVLKSKHGFSQIGVASFHHQFFLLFGVCHSMSSTTTWEPLSCAKGPSKPSHIYSQPRRDISGTF